MNYAVIGCGFGDEGKGVVTNWLCSKIKNSLVVRFSGGHQAAHTVYYKDKHHIFSSFGSGTLQNVPTYWSEYCTFYPKAFLNELDVLLKKKIKPTIYINSDCPVTTPFDIDKNIENEKINKHSSCQVGVGQTYQRQQDKYSLTVLDLLFPNILKEKLKNIGSLYYNKGDCLNTGIEKFLVQCYEFKRLCVWGDISGIQIVNNIPKYKNYIFEGSQGLLLDEDVGFFPYVTRGKTDLTNVYKIIGNKKVITYLVTRSYLTRHGNGYFPNNGFVSILKKKEDETNTDNNKQGKFRQTHFDWELFNYVLKKATLSERKNLVVTCMDRVTDIKYKNRLMNGLKFKKNKTFKNIYCSYSKYGNIENV